MLHKYDFADITLLITHYNRSHSLERLLQKFSDLNCFFKEIIVSDDYSKEEQLEYLKSLQEKFQFTLVTAPANGGLANNINKGQKAVKTDFTLYVQEDFVPKDIFPLKLQQSLEILKDRPEVDMIRYYAYFKYPNLEQYKDGFSEMKFNPLTLGYRKFYYYSDHPHLRRSSFLQKFGNYLEGIKSDVAEYKMMINFLRLKGKAFYYEDFKGLFDQINSELEPSTVKRSSFRDTDNVLISFLRALYRYTKFNIDLYR